MKKTLFILITLFVFTGLYLYAAENQVQTPSVKVKKIASKYYPEGTPTRAIQELDDKLDAYQVGPGADVEHNRALKKEIMSGTFDLRELCRLALAKHWDKRTKVEQDRFVELLNSLLEEKAVFSKEQTKGKGTYEVKYLGDKYTDPNKTRALTRTIVVVKSEKISIELDYKLRKEGNVWMIYDVIVDQASLLNNYRFQFDSIILKSGYEDLVRRMQGKLNQIRQERSGAATTM